MDEQRLGGPCHTAKTNIGTITVSPEITAAVQHVIRNAGFHVGTMPLVDMRNGGSGYVVDARDAETGESWSVIADSEYEATVKLAEQVGIELMDSAEPT